MNVYTKEMFLAETLDSPGVLEGLHGSLTGVTSVLGDGTLDKGK